MNTWKENPAIRMWARAVLAGMVAMSALAATIWIDNPYVKLAAAFFAVIGGYAGVGSFTPLEPFVGWNKVNNVQVPAPPATEEARPEAVK